MILIGLGANLPSCHGSPEETLRAALKALEASSGIHVQRMSSIWLTAPVPVSDQPWYRNAVVAIETSLSAEELMVALQQIETEFGRVRSVRDAPRVLDLDILAYNNEVHENEGCIVPHPRMHSRAFVLMPLREIAPEWVHPVFGVSVQKMIETMPEGQEIEISENRAA